jgi:hypothetical protein
MTTAAFWLCESIRRRSRRMIGRGVIEVVWQLSMLAR